MLKYIKSKIVSFWTDWKFIHTGDSWTAGAVVAVIESWRDTSASITELGAGAVSLVETAAPWVAHQSRVSSQKRVQEE